MGAHQPDLILRPVPALAWTLAITGAWLAYEDYDVVLLPPADDTLAPREKLLYEGAHMLSGQVPSM